MAESEVTRITHIPTFSMRKKFNLFWIKSTPADSAGKNPDKKDFIFTEKLNELLKP